MEWTRDDGYAISDDPARVDRELVHRFLSQESYWVRGISRAEVDRCIDHSLVFGVYRGAEQVGFARVITDTSRLAYVADVFVVATERGRGLGTWLVGAMLEHPALREVRRWLLATDDAHGVYQKLGFAPITADRATRYMERGGVLAADASGGTDGNGAPPTAS